MKKIKFDPATAPPAVLAAMRKDQTRDEIRNTEDAIGHMLMGVRTNLRQLRKRGGDILALQSLTYMFAGNPVALFAHKQLAEEALSTAESVRMWCMNVFKKYGGTGPEVIDRVLGPERNPLLAAHQALVRFGAFVEKAGEVMRDAPAPAAPAGFAEDKQARRIALIKAASERELTPEEHQELLVLRAEFRAAIGGLVNEAAGPRPSDDEIAAHAVDSAMASGDLPPRPETTSPERARELYLAAVKRDLTPEERAEIGLSSEPVIKALETDDDESTEASEEPAAEAVADTPAG